MMQFINPFINLDLVAVGLTITAIGILSFIVFFSNTKSYTNIALLIFSIFTIFWSTLNFLSYQFTSPLTTIWLLRVSIFFGVWHAFSFLHLCYVFPRNNVVFPRWYFLGALPLIGIISILTLTPFMFEQVADFSATGRVSRVINGPGLPIFGIAVMGSIAIGLLLLFKKTLKARNFEKKQFLFVLVGSALTFSLLLTFNFLFPAFLNNARFVPLAPIFIFPFIAFATYAIIKHHLFNIKVITTEIFAFLLSVITLFQIAISEGALELILRSGVFIAVVIFSILLIRSVIREVEARQEIQQLADDLTRANDRLRELDAMKSEFLSFATHQLRSPLTAIKGYASLVLEGSFGKINKKTHEAIDRIYLSCDALLLVVEDFLNIARLEQGRMEYNFEPLNMADVIREVVESLSPNIERAGLKLLTNISEGEDYSIRADHGKIRQVLMNLIDNAIKYTKRGHIKISLFNDEKMRQVRLIVEDTGVGIPREALARLFGKFTRAKNAGSTNVTGTGLGLYIAKEIVKAHHGHIWAESEGEGEGSTFYIELPTNIIVGS